MRHPTLIYVMLISAIIAAAVSSHAAEPTPSVAPAVTPPVAVVDPVFDCYNANSAWGYTLSGKVIDSKGKIWSYGKHGNAWLPTLVKQADATYLKTADLQEKFADPKETGSVDAKAMTDNCALIAKAADGVITRTETGTRDAGTSVCHAYLHDEAQHRYRDIELGTDGGVSDLRVANDAPDAQTLLTWLKSVGVAKQ